MTSGQSVLSQLLARANQLELVRRGRFKLASGRTSHYYIDGRLLSLDAQGAALIGQLIRDRLGAARSIGGPAIGAVPIVTAILADAGRAGQQLAGFYSRPNDKHHGLQQRIEGRWQSPILLVDDTCTTGGSLLELARELESAGGEIDQIITIFDRGGSQAITNQGYRYTSLLALSRGQLVASGSV